MSSRWAWEDEAGVGSDMIFAVGNVTLGTESVASDADTFPSKMIWSVGALTGIPLL